jgi:HAD superfamily hydrolase (TIGR01490 family)
MQRRIAFFDFDGTITTRDTLLEIIKFYAGKPLFYFGFMVNAPFLLAFKCKLIPNYVAKQRILRHFFRNRPLTEFQARCDQFSVEILPSLIRPKALQEIQKLREAGATIVIVSASAGNWIHRWASSLEIPLLATNLEVKDEKITGRIEGHNCYGPEKVNRIKAAYDLEAYDEIYCYGDSGGDKEMLALGNRVFYKPFR